MLAWFHALDLWALYLINQTLSRPWLDPVMAYVSDWNSWRIPVILAVVLTLIFGGFRGRQLLALMAACLVFGDGMINWGFKLAVHRARPMETEWHLRVVTVHEISESQPQPTSRGRSFTSGHACNNVALAFMSCAVFGLRRCWWVWLWAALVSYSRVYTGSHYPSDIVGSWIVAAGYAYAFCRIGAWSWQKWGPTKWPRLYTAHPVLFPEWTRAKKI